MDNPEKLATLGTQNTGRRQAKQKHNTIGAEHHHTRTDTNNVNKTQTAEGKYDPNIVFIQKSQQTL